MPIPDATRDRKAARSREVYASLADIGDIPAVANVRRRERCRMRLEKFLVTYFPNSTGLSPFSEDHKRVIGRMEDCILRGGRFVNAIYRGAGKTSIAEGAALWATLYGHRRFVPVFAAADGYAKRIIDSLKSELANNDLLYEDFPEVCHAIQRLEGKSQRCHSQTYAGELTHIAWTADRAVFPTIRMSVSLAKAKGIPVDKFGRTLNSGAILTATGITGSGARGPKHKRPDGTQQRPDFVIVDDPQTDESARSPLQIQSRLDVIRKGIALMGGHRSHIACVVNATVIERGDLVDQLLDPVRSPGWQGERIPMLRSWSTAHATLWQEYIQRRCTFDRETVGDQLRAQRDATKFYRRHRAEMDAGCIVSWKHCFSAEKGEISAIQHAYNILADDGPEVFASECQQRPVDRLTVVDAKALDAKSIRVKCSGLDRGTAPIWATHLTGFVDVGEDLLYWAVAAFGSGFTGTVIDYGTWPEQGRSYFAARDARPRIPGVLRGMGLEAQFLESLKRLVDGDLMPRIWKQEGGADIRISRLHIDANYNESTDAVYAFCRQSPFSAMLFPSHGKGITASSKPMTSWQEKPGEKLGHHWQISAPGKRAIRHVLFDTNFWKSHLANRWRTAMGDPGAMSLFGREPETHALFADHMVAEFAVATKGRERSLEEWKERPGRPDNHWLDCLVGCCVAASMLGVSLPGQQLQVKRARSEARTRVNFRAPDGRSSFFVTDR